MTIEKLQKLIWCLCHDDWIFERFPLKTNMHFKISDTEIPAQAADECYAPLIEWGWNTFISISASSKHVCSPQTMVLLKTGACFPNQDKNSLVCGVFVFMHLKCKVWDWWAFNVSTGHRKVSWLNKGKKKSSMEMEACRIHLWHKADCDHIR